MEVIINSLKTVELIKKSLEDKHAHDIVIYNVSESSSVTDYFIIATSKSMPQLKAMASGVKADSKKEGVMPYHTSGKPESGWIIVDFVDVVVHLMLPEAREYYALEELWQETEKIEL